MAFSRKGISGDEQSESLLDVPGKPPAALDGIRESGLLEQAQDQIVHHRQNASGCTLGHAGGVFMESDIATIMQAGFDEPMLAPDRKQFRWRSFLSGQAGNAELHFATGFVGLALAHPDKPALQAIHLSKAGPI